MPEYEYHGLMAEAWDVLRGDTTNWDDRFFYLEVIKKYGQPVLDVGCGTGRLLLDYLQQGIDIDGVDDSPDMLAICRQKAAALGLAPKLYQKKIEQLDLPRRYRTILVPSSTIQLITDPDLAERGLKRLRDCIQPDGILAASVMTLWKEGHETVTEEEKEAVRASDGAVFRRSSWSEYHPEKGTEDTRDRYEMLVDGEVIREEQHERSPATRSYTQAEAKRLFERAGFRDITLLSEFTFDPVKPEDWVFVVLARK